ncbi:MAG: ferredoxin [Candidatus Uhrbacteria bacterium]
MDKPIAKIHVDRDLCIGAASCLLAADGVFELDAEQKAVMVRQDGSKVSTDTGKTELQASTISDDDLLAAAQSCPTKAIFLYDAEGGQLYP